MPLIQRLHLNLNKNNSIILASDTYTNNFKTIVLRFHTLHAYQKQYFPPT